jgi:hypothetical protein
MNLLYTSIVVLNVVPRSINELILEQNSTCAKLTLTNDRCRRPFAISRAHHVHKVVLRIQWINRVARIALDTDSSRVVPIGCIWRGVADFQSRTHHITCTDIGMLNGRHASKQDAFDKIFCLVSKSIE